MITNLCQKMRAVLQNLSLVAIHYLFDDKVQTVRTTRLQHC
jgi:hypothetical protein